MDRDVLGHTMYVHACVRACMFRVSERTTRKKDKYFEYSNVNIDYRLLYTFPSL